MKTEEPGCRKSLLILLPGALPLASLRVEWLVVLWVGGYSCPQKTEHVHCRPVTCCDTAAMVWKVNSFPQMDEFQVLANAMRR